MESARPMRNLNRLYCQRFAIGMHIFHFVSLYIAMHNKELLKDPKISAMISILYNYFPLWNVVFQMSYFLLAYLCDYSKWHHMIPKDVKDFRQEYFASIVWPITFLNFVVFYQMFMLNVPFFNPVPELFTYTVQKSLYFWPMMAAVWELVNLPMPRPNSHLKNIGALTSVLVLNVAVMQYTYYQQGLWPYPILDKIYGTRDYHMFLIAMYLISMLCYFSQWKFREWFERL